MVKDTFFNLQLGSAVMLQCPLTGHIIGANAGYLYGVSFFELPFFNAEKFSYLSVLSKYFVRISN